MTLAPHVAQHTLVHDGGVNVARYNAGCSYILTGGQDRSIRLWNSTSGKCIKSYEGHGFEVLDIAVTPDNARFASCGGDRNVMLWDVTNGSVLKRWSGHVSTTQAVAFSFDGNVLASGGFDAAVRLWDCKSQQRMPIQVLEDAKDSISSIIIQSHEIYVSSVDGYVRTYDLRKGCVEEDYFERPVTSICLLSDGKTFLVATLDSTIRLVDRETGELLQSFKGHLNTEYKSKVCTGLGEATIFCGGDDGNVTCWDVESGKTISSLAAHTKVTTCVQHHTKLPQMVTTGADGKAIIWGV